MECPACSGSGEIDELICDDVTIDPANFTVVRNGGEIEIAPRLFRLLEYFMENPRMVLSHKQIYDAVWNQVYDDISAKQSVIVAATQLRKSLGTPAMIRTVRGQGYRFGLR